MPASLLAGVSKPVQSSEGDIDEAEDDGNGDEVAHDDEANKPEIPRQKVT
jgi:hypothetical protein